MSTNKNPYASFKFLVEINNVQCGGFLEVVGLQADTEFEEYREGGVNDYVHKLAKVTKFPNLTLKRGITDAEDLWKWYQKVISGKIVRKEITVVLIESEQEKWQWAFTGAYPVKWSGSDLNATNNTVFVESVEFAHNGMSKVN